MQHISRVRVVRGENGFVVHLTGTDPVHLSMGASGIGAEDIPKLILQMLADRGDRFVGTIPDFERRQDYDERFFVISEPIEKREEQPEYDPSKSVIPTIRAFGRKHLHDMTNEEQREVSYQLGERKR